MGRGAEMEASTKFSSLNNPLFGRSESVTLFSLSGEAIDDEISLGRKGAGQRGEKQSDRQQK